MPQASAPFRVPFHPTLDINRPATFRGRPTNPEAMERKLRNALIHTSRDGLAHCDSCRRAFRTGEFVAVTTGFGRKLNRLCSKCYGSGVGRGPLLGLAQLSPDITLPDRSRQN